MPVVHHAAKAHLVALTLLLLAVGVLAGCGGGGEPAGSRIGVNQSLQLADCDDWNNSDVEARLVTVKQLRDFAGGPVGGVEARGAILDDDQAYDLFEGWCSQDFAGAFKLYKLYTRAAAFEGH